ncbi:MAG: RyR domain-containing protein [Methanobrevibacter sp.]|nr:RyR domain-containing protein [Methanobrevibacter sp.]
MAKERATTNNIKEYVDDFFKDLVLFDDYVNNHDYKSLLKSGIDVFLDFESDYTAKDIYRTFLMIYQITNEDKSEGEKNINVVSEPNILLNLVEVMEKYEKNTGDLIERQRDHFIHSVNVFILGLAIYSQNENYREIFRNHILSSKYEKHYRIDGEFSDEEFLYRWGIASLFHDIGYPFEIIGKQLNKIIGDSVKSISNSYDVAVSIDFKDFNEFNSIVKMDPYDFADSYRDNYKRSKILDLYRPTDIMAHKIAYDFQLDEQKFKLLTSHLNNFVNYMQENRFIDHGFYSSILVLNSYGKLMQKHDKDYDFFFYPIVDSATAILLHNYYNKTLQKSPFNLKLLSPETNPIAFLLILCDELQEWNRQPFGLIDKRKFHVNDLILDIDNDKMDVEYILNFGSMGLGFSKDKKEFIYDVLDVESIFRKGLSVITDVKEDVEHAVMRDMDILDIQVPSVLLRNVEKLAIEIHEQYVDLVTEEYEYKLARGEVDNKLQNKYDSLCSFKELSPELKMSNIRQALSIPKKLNMIGCEIATKSDPRTAITEDDFEENEVLNLAIFEHQEWCEEKRGTGWTKGDEKDEEKRISPYLVSWDELDEYTKQVDKDAVLKIPYLLDCVGLKIVRTKIRLLTFKMHEFYENKRIVSQSSGENEFRELPGYVQYSNYKQADFIVQILKERGYELVSLDDKRPSISSFSRKDIEHFAEREHYAWYMLKFNLGWRYGENNQKCKTNSNLVPWEKLDEKVKENNRNTFIHLPMLCADPNVGLKIVRSE